jgi:hypothetical protein
MLGETLLRDLLSRVGQKSRVHFVALLTIARGKSRLTSANTRGVRHVFHIEVLPAATRRCQLSNPLPSAAANRHSIAGRKPRGDVLATKVRGTRDVTAVQGTAADK